MTKSVRIENADTASYKVKVTIQERKYVVDHGVGKLSDEWTTVSEKVLDYPTAMFTDYLTNSKRFIVEEV